MYLGRSIVDSVCSSTAICACAQVTALRVLHDSALFQVLSKQYCTQFRYLAVKCCKQGSERADLAHMNRRE